MSRARTLAIGWTAALLAMTAFAALGGWQLARMQQKRAMLADAARVLARREPQPLAIASDPARARGYDWAAGSGAFAAADPLLLDNQLREGRPGVRVYRLFHPASGGALLVDLGWLPVAGDRVLPAREVLRAVAPGQPLEVRGLLVPPPSSGLAMGGAIARRQDAWLLTRIDAGAIERAAGARASPLAPRVLRLDPAMPWGHARDLDILPNTLPPERHLGYAVQWFALAFAVLATAVVLTLRKPAR